MPTNDILLESALNDWQQRLVNISPNLELPIDRPRPAKPSNRGAIHTLTLPVSLSESLKTLSHQQDVTLFTTLLAAFKILLHRYCDQDDIVVGTSRTERGQDNLMETLTNLQLLHTNLTRQPTFYELLGRVQKSVLETQAQQTVSFKKLVEMLQSEQSQSRLPLFQVMFQFVEAALPNDNIKAFEFDGGQLVFDLILQIIEQEHTLSCLFTYKTDLFNPDTIKRMAGHFQTLLKGIVTNPNQSISRLPLLTKAEQYRLLVEWNEPKATYITEGQMRHQLFQIQVEKTPEAIAVVFEDDYLTYKELDQRANQVAHHLQALNVGPDVLVGIFMERSLELVIASLGILKAGGVCLPLDPIFPLEQLAFMVIDSAAPVILTHEQLYDQLPPHQATVVCLDTEWEIIAQQSVLLPVSEVTIENLAFIFYTSGSMGQPKAVMRPRLKGIKVKEIDANQTQSRYKPTATDRHLLKSSIGFTAFDLEIFWPLITGGRMIIARPGQERDMTYLIELIIDHGITILDFVPSMLRIFLEQLNVENCTELKYILCFGEALPPELQEKLFARLDVTLSVTYGTTEGPNATSWSHNREDTQQIVSIGRRSAGRQLYILDAHLQPVPIGIPGELYVEGFLARGYLNRPDLTAERFIPNPFSDTPGTRMYKTGDRVRYLADGSLEFIGRVDDQVQIRGGRVEPHGIEMLLEQHPEIQKVAVLAREDEFGHKYLVAYIVSNLDISPKISKLRHFLQQKVPSYMIPSAFVPLDTLPLTLNGKIDRRALPEPDQTRPELENTFVPPSTPIEEALTKIWGEILGLEQVGIYDNFFELGGHSLLATQVISRIRDTLQVELPLHRLFEGPTVADLAKYVETVHRATKNLQPPGEIEGREEIML